MLCSACGRENLADARFCHACGAPLTAGSDHTEERKVVTVLFTDVAGSTALGERLDPELLRRVMWRYFDAVQAVLERHGGVVEKFIGDAVMAVFGIPSVREDDALRAVRAASELGDRLSALNAELESEHGVVILTRTGINTGEVIVGGGAGDQKLATGDAVNVAARLEQAAEPGEVLLGEATYEAVRDAVVAEATAPLAAKGKARPLAARRLLGLRPDVPAFARPISTPFVGRRDELEELRGAFDAVVRERSCALATIVGTPGMGKSRLARELIGSLETEARIVVGRCIAYGQGITYLPLADVVREVAGEDLEAGLERILTPMERGNVAARLIAGAVGAHEEGGSPEETAWAFRSLFETLAANRPLVVVVDDIHWAEPALLDLLEYVVGFSSGAPILILCLARPDLFDVRASWSAPRQRATLVSLDPLGRAESDELIEGLLRDHDVDEQVRRRIVETAEGNPLFVEQMLAMLFDDPDAGDAVPPTIQALLAARIDRLEAAERAVIQRASVEGRLFHRGAVSALLEDGAGLGGTLLALARKEFVRPDRSLFPGDDGFRFNHVLIRDVAYGSMSKELRAELHGRLAAWLTQREGAQLTGHDEIVGYHLEQAYRYRSELGRSDDDTRALALEGGRLLRGAGRRALDRQEPAAAAALLDRAAQLLTVEPGERVALLPDVGRALRESGSLDAAENAVAEAIEQARHDRDELTEARAQVEQARLSFMRTQPEPDQLRATAKRVLAVFERIGDESDLADGWQVMGVAELAARDRGAQLVALRAAREHAIASGDVRRQIDAWNEVGGAMIFGRTPLHEIREFLEEELAWAREHGLAAVEADALLGGPYIHARLGDFDKARDYLERSKAICRELGLAYGLAEAHMAGGQLEMLAQDPAAAERELHEAIRLAVEMGASRYAALYRVRIAHVLIAQGRYEDAAGELERAADLYDEVVTWKTAHARVLASGGKSRRQSPLRRKPPRRSRAATT